jgi:PilZ domain
MDRPVNDRRHDVRRSGPAWRVEHVTLRPGRHVVVVDLSPAGAQVESDRPLRPGSRVHIRIVTDRWTVSLAAHVLRCAVCAIHPEEGVTYRGALRFDERCERMREDAAQRGAGSLVATG